jgi:hypothetical protein
MQDDYKSSWPTFIDEVQKKILPIYTKHELTFDPGGVHGRMHICRSLIFSEWMARFYQEHMAPDVDFWAIRVATAMHDSGRRANGVDLWENDSSTSCFSYVERSPRAPGNPEYARYVASLIDKRRAGDTSKWIVYDADVLEIMRPCCGHGGIGSFRREFLHFCGANDQLASRIPDAVKVREDLIQESWRWITETESLKSNLFLSPTYLTHLLDRLDARRFPLLASLLQ